MQCNIGCLTELFYVEKKSFKMAKAAPVMTGVPDGIVTRHIVAMRAAKFPMGIWVMELPPMTPHGAKDLVTSLGAY